jgi:hypothetical protein
MTGDPDFIFFVYGLFFLLLGGVLWGSARGRKELPAWTVLKMRVGKRAKEAIVSGKK